MSSEPPARRICVVLLGATGRMGQAILRAAGEFPALAWVAAIASRDSAALGRDSGICAGVAPNYVPVTGDLAPVLARAEVVMDFTTAAATRAHLEACRRARKALLIGTTGFAPELEAEFAAAAREIPLLVAPNTSLGVTLLLELVRLSSRALPESAPRILERHHAGKRDAPSGTALALASALAAARPHGSPASDAARIPIESVREGEVVGEHTALFASPGEELFLGHRASDRAVFARGALAAALWLASKPAGRYSMRDLLDVETVT
jgi:4-hydroxy-tetrahydrodipicolinate reductase